MNNYQIPVWATLALAGSLFASLSAGVSANTPVTPPVAGATAKSLAAFVPTRLTATGLINPIGSQVQLTWVPVPKALGYKIYRDGQFIAGSDHGFFIDYAVAGGETHTYTVTSVSLGGESPRSTAATAKVPMGGGQVLYSDSLQNSWQSWSWASVNVSSPSTLLNRQTLRVAAGPWQALYLHHAKFNTAPYSAVSFLIYGGAPAGQKLWMRATRSGVAQPPVALPPLVSGQWQTVTISLSSLGAANVTDMDGLWVQDGTGTTQAPFYLSQIVLKSTTVAAPTAPAGLAATPAWTASCPKCGGKAMAHILLAWNAVPGASSYTLYRNGAKLQDGLTTPNFTDMAIVSGQKYQYAVAAVSVGGTSPQSPPAAAIAPNPPVGTLGVPFNIAVNSNWTGVLTPYGNGVSNYLAWAPAPGAVSYNVYQSDVLVAHGLTTTAFTVTPDVIQPNALYAVTAVDSQGTESLPSAPVSYQDAQQNITAGYWAIWNPNVPDTPIAVPEWNQGRPRILVKWFGHQNPMGYSLYRDGKRVASGLWQAYYIDADVQPGESHSYAVAGDNLECQGVAAICPESALSSSVTATALKSAPAALGSKVQITKFVPSDDSCVVFFTPIAGATDYRIYDAANPAKVKYAGEITLEKRYDLQPRTPICIEWNGIDPAKGADLVVEAVDKFGPFQRMDGTTMGTMNMAGMSSMAINGQGDPSNVPNVLAQSDTFHVDCRPATLGGSQVFFDNFQNSGPLVRQPCPAPVADSDFYGHPNDFAIYENDKWQIRQYGADLTNSKVFFMGNHFMDTTYDGGGIGSSSPPHNNDATMVMMPKSTADISGGQVLHVTFEVDAHFDSRRWCELLIGMPNDLLLNPAKFAEFQRKPTQSGIVFRWQIQSDTNTLQLFTGDPSKPGIDLLQYSTTEYSDQESMMRINWDYVSPLANGTTQDLDKRHRFDLYLSKTHYRISETTPDGMYNMIRDKDFPAGVSLPFDKCQVYFDHQVYHTHNDHDEVVSGCPQNYYWSNYRPFSDERHWDNMGFSVLPNFPAMP